MTETEHESTPQQFQLGNLMIDLGKGRIRRANGSRVRLTCQERRLLGALLESPGHVLPYTDLARSLWGKADGFSGAALRRCALRLRHKLGKGHLQTIYGIGYRLNEHLHPNTEVSPETPWSTP